jgi:flagellar basal body rod protein FlgB
MSFSTMFAAPIAAIRSQSQAFQVISENIANSVTPGFKAADTRFSEVLSQTAGSDFEPRWNSADHPAFHQQTRLAGADRQ